MIAVVQEHLDVVAVTYTDQARHTLTQLRDMDPDDLLGDIQLRALNRLHGLETAECGHQQAGQTCTRPADHTRRSPRSRRHVTACGTWRWDS